MTSDLTQKIIAKPSPVRDAASAPFFDGAAQGKLMILRCTGCDAATLTFSYCPDCGSTTQWSQASGNATVFSWSVVHQAGHPGFAGEVPYVVATVKLAEGPRLMTRLVDVTPSDVKLGMPVRVRFQQAPNGEFVPEFGE